VRIEHLSVDGERDFSTWVMNVLRLTTERSEVGQVFKILDTGQDREQHWQS